MGRGYDGIDCWGLVWLFYKEQMGIDIPRYDSFTVEEYQGYGLGRFIIKETLHWWEKTQNPENGDMVLCKDGRHPMHIGIYKKYGKMLHIYEGRTPSMARLDDYEWNNKVLGIYSLKSR